MKTVIISLLLVCASISGVAQEIEVSLYKQIQESEPDTNRLNLQLLFARTRLYISPDSALEVLKPAADLAFHLQEWKKFGEVQMVLGSCYIMVSNYEESIFHFEYGKEVFSRINDDRGRSGCTMGLAIVNGMRGSYLESLQHYQEALQIAESENDSVRVSQIYNNIVQVHMGLKDYESALASLKEAVKYKTNDKRYGTENSLAGVYGNMGIIYIKLSEPDTNKLMLDSALIYLRKSVNLNILEGDSIGLATTYGGMATANFWLGNKDSTIYYEKKSTDLHRKTNSAEKIASHLVDASYFYAEYGDYQQAMKHASEALEIAKAIGRKPVEKDANEMLARCYKELGRSDLAMDHYMRYSNLKDSLLDAQKIRDLTTQELNYDFNKRRLADSIDFAKKEEIATLAMKAQKAEISKGRFQNILLWGGIAVLVLLSLYIWRRMKVEQEYKNEIIRSNLEKAALRERQLALELQLKNKQLTSKTLKLIRKNETLSDIKQKIEELEVDDAFQNQSRDIKSTINYSFHLDKDWENFKTQFSHIHEHFFENLSKEYPKLTENQIRLCALVRLKMNIKEAAAVLNVSPNSVRIARVRLRKKLKLNKEDSLEQLIAAI